ncbi:hypothetical protein [Nocardioides sp. GXQ0305]|uniref:hypothetical protein n=1 Tax=Nocardioides sp. GXQ0305 TaxID=3423912 RepID=UPI003D7D8161
MNHDDLTDQLREQLRAQVDGLAGAPLPFESVRGRAHAIRRTRRIAAASVAAVAVVAIALPVSLLGDPANRGDSPPEIADTPTQAEEQVPPPAIPYVDGTTLTMPDGTERELPASYTTVAVLGEKVLGVSIDPQESTATLERIEGGEVTSSEELADSGLALNPEGTSVAYVRSDGELVVESEDDQAGLGYHGTVQPVRLFGGGICGAEDGQCLVFVDDGRTPKVISGPDDVTELPDDPLAVEDASSAAGRVAMLMSIAEREPGSCSRVVSNDGAVGEVFETCEVTLSRFSPGGDHLSAGPAYQSGIGDSFVAIVDGETGDEVARHEPADGFVGVSVWEDAEHLLALSHESGEWSVVRLGVDGSVETVLGPVAGDELEPPWRLVGAS